MNPQRSTDSPVGSASPPDGPTERDAAVEIAPNLTVRIDGPSAVGAQVDLEAADLGPIITSEMARGLRPDLDDPTRLTNGALHPRYAEWISSRTWTDQHPLNEYLTHEDRLGLLSDDGGYFDRKRIRRELGP